VSEIAEQPSDVSSARIEVLSWLNRMTLDVIGLAGAPLHRIPLPLLSLICVRVLGFNYKFDSLNVEGKPNELNQAFGIIFRASRNRTLFMLLSFFPIFRRLSFIIVSLVGDFPFSLSVPY
jgi:hypothetical protein